LETFVTPSVTTGSARTLSREDFACYAPAARDPSHQDQFAHKVTLTWGGLLSITTYVGGVAEDTYLPTFNLHGDVTSLIDQGSGTVTATFAYSAFGTRTAEASSDPAAVAACAFGFDTYYWDQHAGVYLLPGGGHSPYSPELGEWLTRDPIGQESDKSGRARFHADPINRIDPDGRSDRRTVEEEYVWLDSDAITNGHYIDMNKRPTTTPGCYRHYYYKRWANSVALKFFHPISLLYGESIIDAYDYWVPVEGMTEETTRLARNKQFNKKLAEGTQEQYDHVANVAGNVPILNQMIGEHAADTYHGFLISALLPVASEIGGKIIEVTIDGKLANVRIDPGKFKYVFGEVASNTHNEARSIQNVTNLGRIGIFNDARGIQTLTEHLASVFKNNSNIIETFSAEFKPGVVQNFEVRDSLLQGPLGWVKVESSWEILPDGTRRFCSLIAKEAKR
jgi:RHS repeat-associated protein